jgi:hypothetical protein
MKDCKATGDYEDFLTGFGGFGGGQDLFGCAYACPASCGSYRRSCPEDEWQCILRRYLTISVRKAEYHAAWDSISRVLRA